jgi:hypothetical protein
MHKSLSYVLSYGQVLHTQCLYWCPVLRTSSPSTRHSFMFCPQDKFSMHKALNYVLSYGQVLHTQCLYWCSVLRASSPCTRHSFLSCPKDKLCTMLLKLYRGKGRKIKVKQQFSIIFKFIHKSNISFKAESNQIKHVN